jgi:8-oxo-dGTP pyrophosphatase MutT (NUDIX family)
MEVSLPAPTLQQPLPADWLLRLRGALAPAPLHDAAHWRLGGLPLAATGAVAAALAIAAQPAAVLVPIIARPAGPTLLLTLRAGHLRSHAGQVSFPGGRLESGDADPVAAALRETREEIGIAPGFIAPLGFMPDHIVLTGYRITPVVALVQPGFTLQVDAAEVDEVFEMPLQYLLAREHFLPTTRSLHGFVVTLSDLLFAGHRIWGATAGMLLALHEALQEPA